MDNATILVIIMVFVTFSLTYELTKIWIKIAKSRNLVGTDMNKLDKKECAEAGGIAVILALTFGLFGYVFLKTYLFHSETHFINVLAIINTILLAGFLGFIDDVLGWKKGLSQWQKPLLTIPIALPLAVLGIGMQELILPFLGKIEVGLLFPLFFVPLAIVGASNGFNMLAGLNGLEAGMGAIILGALTLLLAKGTPWLALISGLACASLICFLMFNWYPAKVFPGNSLTYAVGALIGIVAILSEYTKAAILLFLPYFLELFLKARCKFKGESFGIPQKDGSLKPPEKICSLTHIFMKFAKTEKRTVLGILSFELVLAFLVIILYL
ncbi:MAG: glycosyl transferase family 4 [Candidatus Nanoarchaeia archaeon]